jgi:tRNA (cytidine32/uridine32-2'-O)-methyltransferase
VKPDSVQIVLVRPARGANVAAACRAMKNMGLERLCLVGERLDMDRPEVRALAYGAWDVFDGARHAASLEAAVAASTLVVATSSRPGGGDWTPRRLAAEGAARAGGGAVSIVFGPEASGLTNEEQALCHQRVVIPAHPDHPSLNLAQAVLVVAYEIWLSAADLQPPPAPDRAAAGEIEEAVQALRQGLLGIGYLSAASPEPILAELRALVVRAQPTPREVTLLRGIARQVAWAAAQIARGREADG